MVKVKSRGKAVTWVDAHHGSVSELCTRTFNDNCILFKS